MEILRALAQGGKKKPGDFIKSRMWLIASKITIEMSTEQWALSMLHDLRTPFNFHLNELKTTLTFLTIY